MNDALRQINIVPPGNQKRAAFARLAEKRTNAILDRIRILGHLSNRSAYEYSEEDVRKVFGVIEDELRLTKARFLSGGRRRFRLE
jgi:hypothetical protein